MNDEQIKERWVTRESRAKLSSLLGLTNEPYMQDWELECADACRICEFLDLYGKGSLNDDDRFALMALIVASFDDWLSEGGADEAILLRIRHLLDSDFKLHEATICHWCLPDESDSNNVFSATPFMREIWKQHR